MKIISLIYSICQVYGESILRIAYCVKKEEEKKLKESREKM